MEDKVLKRHYWIRQLRKPICLIIVVVFVISYSLSALAFSSGYYGFCERFGIENMSNTYLFGYSDAYSRYGVEHNNAYLWTNYTSPIRTNYGSNYGSSVASYFATAEIPESLTYQTVIYDLTNAYVIACCEGSWVDNAGKGFKYVVPQGYCCLVNQYIVSESPFSFVYWESGSTLRALSVNEASGNGYYCLNLTNYAYGNADYRLCFTDLDIFVSSSDGGSGFTTFALDTTNNFDINYQDNYNFNYLKSDDLIVGSGDPDGGDVTNSAIENAYHNMAISIRKKYSGWDNAGFLWGHYYMSYNDYILTYPELFDLHTDYKIKLKFVTYSGTESEYEYDWDGVYNFRDIFDRKNNSSWSESFRQAILMSQFDADIDALGHHTLEDDYNYAVNAIAGNQSNILDWLSSIEQFGNDIANLCKLKSSFIFQQGSNERGLKEFYIEGTTYVTTKDPNDGSLLYSKTYVDSYNFLTGTYNVINNEISQNAYPYENGDPSGLPSGNVNYGESGGSGTYYGGSNNAYAQGGQGGNVQVTVNPDFEPYTMSMGEYGNMADIFNNIRDAFQQLGGSGGSNTRTAGDSSSDNGGNNFLSVMGETFRYIPSNVWNVMMVSISIVSGVAVVKFVRNRR